MVIDVKFRIPWLLLRREALSCIIVALVLSGCGVQHGSLAVTEPSTGEDFAKTRIISVKSEAYANGIDEATIELLIAHSNGSVAVGVQPTLAIALNSSYSAQCTLSNAQGRSTCKIKSQKVGPLNLTINVAQFNFVQNITFKPVTVSGTGYITQASSSPLLSETSSGGKAILQIKYLDYKAKNTTQDSYLLMGTVLNLE